VARVTDKPNKGIYSAPDEETTDEIVQSDSGDETPTDDLAPDEVRTSDGRIFKVKETWASHDNRVDMFLQRQGLGTDFQGVGVSIYMRYCALCAIVAIDGKVRDFPKSIGELNGIMGTLRGRDMVAIVKKYVEVNGLDGEQDKDGDFRPE
jgi:hypothetical protein